MAQTVSAGSGICNDCGKSGTLFKCKYCGITKCFSCWRQKYNGINTGKCPHCGK